MYRRADSVRDVRSMSKRGARTRHRGAAGTRTGDAAIGRGAAVSTARRRQRRLSGRHLGVKHSYTIEASTSSGWFALIKSKSSQHRARRFWAYLGTPTVHAVFDQQRASSRLP
jgi:hypothetical protein